MSKVKEAYVKQLEDDFELDLNYQEWLRENFSEANESELDEMEHDYIKKPYYDKNRIITTRSLNNPNYNPTHSA
jgi:hypothetical protein